MAIALTTFMPDLRVLTGPHVDAPLAPHAVRPAGAVDAMPDCMPSGVRGIRPWTQSIATIDMILTRAHRLEAHVRATGTPWDADAVLAHVLNARGDTPSVVLGMRYERVLQAMTYAERDQLIDAVRVCARVPKIFQPFMERVRACRDPQSGWVAMDINEFLAAFLARTTHLPQMYQKMKDRLPIVWAMELLAAHRGCTGRELDVNLAEAELMLAECTSAGLRMQPETAKRRILGMSCAVRERYSTQELHRNFERTLQREEKGRRQRIEDILEICTAFGLALDLETLRALAQQPPPQHVPKGDFYRRVLSLDALSLASARKRIVVMLRNATPLTVAAYCDAHQAWCGERPDDFARRARHAVEEVQRTNQRMTHEVFKRLILDASTSMSHDEVLHRYDIFRTVVFTAEERAVIDAALQSCTGYKDGRCGKAMHAQYEKDVAVRGAWAETLAARVQAGEVPPMDFAAYAQAFMQQGRATRAKSTTNAYRGFLSWMDAARRAQFLGWERVICKTQSIAADDRVYCAMQCALEVQEGIARGGAYLSVRDFQRRVMKNAEESTIGETYYRFRDALDQPLRELLDAAMLAAAGRPPHWRGRHPPRQAQISVAGIAQRGIAFAVAQRQDGKTVSPTAFYQHLFGNTVPVTELHRIFVLVQRQSTPEDRVLLDAALGMATNSLWVNGGIVPLAYLEGRGVNGARQWWIVRDAGDHVVTSMSSAYLDAVTLRIRTILAAPAAAQ